MTMNDPGKRKAIEDYWMRRLSGDLPKPLLPMLPDSHEAEGIKKAQLRFDLPGAISAKLEEMSADADIALFILVFTALNVVLNRYTGVEDLVIGTVTPRKETVKDRLILCRNRISEGFTFKETLHQVKQRVLEDFNYADYTFGVIYQKLLTQSTSDTLDMFNIAFIYEGLQTRIKALRQFELLFVLSGSGDQRFLEVDYNANRYSPEIIHRLCRNLVYIFDDVSGTFDRPVSQLEIVCAEEQQELWGFNQTSAPFPGHKTIHQLFEEQVEKTPGNTAVIDIDGVRRISYRELNEKANQLAGVLSQKGVTRGSIVGIMETPSIEMVVEMLAILKAGGAYLPIDPAAPKNRVVAMLDDCDASLLITRSDIVKNFSYSALQGLKNQKAPPVFTPTRKQITNLDSLPIPDRSMVNYETYNHYIGQVMAKNIISLQTARGCPFNCAYCSEIWPSKHVVRTAENIFEELQIYYNMGVRRFSIFDDIFNVNIKNGKRLFQLIIDNGLDVQLFFPNGMRGDLLDKEYIDLAVEAGLSATAMALETASPRLQRLIKKNLNLEKFRENIEYFCEKHPQVILELFTMHGFPSETEEEAHMTMDFIKSLKWVHFPYIFILKIYPGTEMADLAVAHGVYREDILRCEDMAFHELSPTSPFDPRFTKQYQMDFLNDYFLSKERLLHVLPFQAKVLTEDEIVQKYNSYLPFDIERFEDILELAGIQAGELHIDTFREEAAFHVPDLNRKLREYFPVHRPSEDALRVLVLDLTQYFTHDTDMLYDVVEPPLGTIYIMTYLKEQLGENVNGKILKSRIDFDSYEELKSQLDEFNPDVIGVRSLTFYRDFFHKTIGLVRQWGFEGVIIAGGPYATRNPDTLIQDRNIDLLVLSEGEWTFCEIISKIIKNGGQLPEEGELRSIDGIVFLPRAAVGAGVRELLLLDTMDDILSRNPVENGVSINHSVDMAYIMFTSGSTGIPRGVVVEHRNVVNVLTWFARAYQLEPGVRVLQLSNYTFDPSVEQIFGTLIHGAELYIGERELAADKEAFRAFIDLHRIHIINFVPGALKHLLEDGEPPQSLRALISGGDKLEEDLKRELITKGYPLYNQYGPTETTIDALMEKCSEAKVTLGSPIANVQCHVFLSDNVLSPIGVTGELYIGGAGVARGYLNNPGLTNSKFQIPNYKQIPNSKSQITNTYEETDNFSHHSSFFTHHSALYRTGDRVRWLPEGKLEFIGRSDHQVKLRGLRIELGEIESRLLKYPAVKEAVVLLREKNPGEKYLCAYIVSAHRVEVSDLKDYLSGTLPAYMIPAVIMQMDKLPLTPNGKIDRNALPVPERGGRSQVERRAPREKIEHQLADLWAEILNINKERFGIDDDFFDLGGHSYSATLLVSRIHKEFNIKISLVEFFKKGCILEVAQHIKEGTKDTFIFIEPVEKKEYYPLSPAQRRLFILWQMDETSTGYNVPSSLELEGVFDKERLERVFKQLIRRHETLRTSVATIGGEPVQKIHENVEFCILYSDLAAGDVGERIHHFIRAFDLSKAPLLRVELLTLAENSHILMLDMHHMITDGASTGVLVKEFMALYSGVKVSPLKLHYKAYAQWQQRQQESGLLDTPAAFWKKQFQGNIPVLELPTDFARPAVRRFEGRRINFEITSELAGQLKALAKNTNVTLFMVLLSAYYIFLSRISGQETVVIGTAVAGRSHADLESIIGIFVNTLGLKNHVDSQKTINTFLQEINRRTLEAFENQEYPFEQLVEEVAVKRDTGRNPLFDVMLVLQNIDIPKVEVPGLKLRPYGHETDTAKFDLTLQVQEVGEEIGFVFEYSTNLFKEATIWRFVDYFKTVLSTIASQPQARIADIEIMTEAEKHQILVEFNDTTADFPRDKTLHRLFEEQVSKRPDHIALIGPIGPISPTFYHLTYQELNKMANRVAHFLILKGVGVEGIVGIMAERSIDVVAGILGVLKAGAAYLPISPDLPATRKKFMVEDSQASHMLVQPHVYFQNKDCMECLAKENIVFLGNMIEEEGEYAAVETVPNPEVDVSPGCPGYIIYTSGSTGRPKGVVLEHRGIVNYVYWAAKQYVKNERVCFPFYTSISFDLTVTSIFTPLVTGNAIVVYSDSDDETDFLLKKVIEDDRVDMVKLTPSHLKLIRETMVEKERAPGARRLKGFIVGGENLETRLAEDMVRYFGSGSNINFDIYNEYGPTETVVGSMIHRFDPTANSRASVSIGTPINNTHIYLLDKNKKPVPMGTAGEIHISGDGVARGYLNNPELTKDRFNRSYKSYRTYISYRTGDLARWHANGGVEFLGRIDQQVKIRGFRIEPGEIEARLLEHPQVKEAVVRPGTDNTADSYLCAYFVPENESALPDLRDYLSRDLPGYMIPSYFVSLEKIPLTANGKVDWQALPEPGTAAWGDEYTAPGNDVEEKLAEIWAEVLDIEKDKISIHTDFFEVGGHSMNAIRMLSAIHKMLEVKLTLQDIFKNPTIKGLAKIAARTRQETYRAVEPVEKKEYYPLSSAQMRLYITQQMKVESTAYNISQPVPLREKPETKQLEKAFRQLIRRHESLRTSFEIIAGEIVQRVHDPEDIPFEIEYDDTASEERPGIHHSSFFIHHFIRAFDLSKAPLLRVGVARAASGKYLLLVDMHHIISDGVSHNILARDFAALYIGTENSVELPPLRLQYKDYAEWQTKHTASDAYKQQENHWSKTLQGELPILTMPLDFKRPERQSFDGHVIPFTLSREVMARLNHLVKEQDVTLNILLFAIYSLLISKYSDQDDIIIGSLTAGRNHGDLERIIGMFANFLPIRITIEPGVTFIEFLQAVKQTLLRAYENQDYPFEKLIDLLKVPVHLSRNPLFDTMMIFHNQPVLDRSQLGSIADFDSDTSEALLNGWASGTSTLDLKLDAVPGPSGELYCILQYDTTLFKEETIRNFSRHFCRLIDKIFENPQEIIA